MPCWLASCAGWLQNFFSSKSSRTYPITTYTLNSCSATGEEFKQSSLRYTDAPRVELSVHMMTRSVCWDLGCGIFYQSPPLYSLHWGPLNPRYKRCWMRRQINHQLEDTPQPTTTLFSSGEYKLLVACRQLIGGRRDPDVKLSKCLGV